MVTRLFARWLENWPYKLMALAVAVLLRVQVEGQLNPRYSQTITVPVVVRNVPPGLLATDYTSSVDVQVSGPTSAVNEARPNGLRPEDITASIDLSRAKPGSNGNLPISISLTRELKDAVTVDSKMPGTATASLDQAASVTAPVSVRFNRIAPVGYSYQPAILNPAVVHVTGPSALLRTMRKLVVYVDDGDPESVPTRVSGTYTVIALDAHDGQVQGLTLDPKSVGVIIPVTHADAIKSLVVSPQVTGTPAYPGRIVQVAVSPETVLVTGPAPLLAQLSVVTTKPINVSGVGATVRRSVPLDLPAGLTTLEPGPISVTVRIEKSAPPTTSMLP